MYTAPAAGQPIRAKAQIKTMGKSMFNKIGVERVHITS